MAVCLQSNVASDLCIGKPSLRSIPITASVGEALAALREWGEAKLGVVLSERKSKNKEGGIAGEICMVDVMCYLCSQQNINRPVSALQNPVSVLLSKDDGAVRAIDPGSSILDVLDGILDENVQALVVPIRHYFANQKQKHQEFSWLTQEDLLRFFLNNIFLFSSIASLSVADLGLVRRDDVLSIHHHRPAASVLPLLRSALLDGSSVAVVTDDGKLIGDVPPSTLSACDDTVACAVASLSVAELMAYIDDCCSYGAASEPALQRVKARLQEEGLMGMLGLLEGNEVTFPTSSSSSDDDESAKKSRKPRRMRSGSYMGRRSDEVAVCYEESSLVAVMVQALAHRVSYVWVVEDEEEFGLVGIVTFQDMLRVFREQIQ